jgi:hypothetical protein
MGEREVANHRVAFISMLDRPAPHPACAVCFDCIDL